jgi:hypothetical protein
MVFTVNRDKTMHASKITRKLQIPKVNKNKTSFIPESQIILDSTTKNLFYSDGTQWVSAGGIETNADGCIESNANILNNNDILINFTSDNEFGNATCKIVATPLIKVNKNVIRLFSLLENNDLKLNMTSTPNSTIFHNDGTSTISTFEHYGECSGGGNCGYTQFNHKILGSRGKSFYNDNKSTQFYNILKSENPSFNHNNTFTTFNYKSDGSPTFYHGKELTKIYTSDNNYPSFNHNNTFTTFNYKSDGSPTFYHEKELTKIYTSDNNYPSFEIDENGVIFNYNKGSFKESFNHTENITQFNHNRFSAEKTTFYHDSESTIFRHLGINTSESQRTFSHTKDLTLINNKNKNNKFSFFHADDATAFYHNLNNSPSEDIPNFTIGTNNSIFNYSTNSNPYPTLSIDKNEISIWDDYGDGNYVIRTGGSGSGTTCLRIGRNINYYEDTIAPTVNHRMQKQLYFDHENSYASWSIGVSGYKFADNDFEDTNLYFYSHNPLFATSGIVGYIGIPTVKGQINFTGQHPCIIENYSCEQLKSLEGLIVICDKDTYHNINSNRGIESITINESLPLVSLCTKALDKRVFGVISTVEDSNNRSSGDGYFKSIIPKEEGDHRVFINSVGEGALWVINSNGPLMSGDYITSSNICGYGMKQVSDQLMNYTVAKITCNCDFTSPLVNCKKIKKKTIAQTIDEFIEVDKSEDYTDLSWDEEKQGYIEIKKTKIIKEKQQVFDEYPVFNSEGIKIRTHKVQRKKTITIEVNDLDSNGMIQH